MPEVSVIIPTYNAGAFLPAAINSVLNQTYGDLEVIVIDDGSNDGTWEVLTPFKNRVQCLHITSSGPAAARNLGIAKSKGKYIAFLDADDWWLPHKLETQIKILSQNPNAFLICSDWFDGQTGEEAKISVLSNYKAWIHTANFDLMLQENFVNTSTVLLEREKLLKVGFFQENLRGAEDKNLWLRLLLLGDALVCKDILAFRRFHSKNTTSTVSFVKGQVEMMRDLLTWPAVAFNPFRFELAKSRYNELRVGLAYKLSMLEKYDAASVIYGQLFQDSFHRFHSGTRYLWYKLIGLLTRK